MGHAFDLLGHTARIVRDRFALPVHYHSPYCRHHLRQKGDCVECEGYLGCSVLLTILTRLALGEAGPDEGRGMRGYLDGLFDGLTLWETGQPAIEERGQAGAEGAAP